MDYNAVGFLGLFLLFAGLVVGVWDAVRPGYGSVNSIVFSAASLIVGMSLVCGAAIMQNHERASKCHETGGIYLHRERACLPAEILKGSLP